MPKSKRNKIVELSKTKKHGMEGKEKLYSEIRSCVESYGNIFIFSVNNMRNNKIKAVRNQWRHSRFFIGKNKVMAKALGLTPEEEFRRNIHKIGQRLRGERGLLFTNLSTDEVLKWFNSFCEGDFARSGSRATETIILKKGPVPRFPHSLEPYLRKLGLPTALQKGVIHVIQDHTVCTGGEILTPEAARILKLLDHQMAEFSIKIECYWSQDGSFTSLVPDSVFTEKANNVNPESKKVSKSAVSMYQDLKESRSFKTEKISKTVDSSDDEEMEVEASDEEEKIENIEEEEEEEIPELVETDEGGNLSITTTNSDIRQNVVENIVVTAEDEEENEEEDEKQLSEGEDEKQLSEEENEGGEGEKELSEEGEELSEDDIPKEEGNKEVANSKKTPQKEAALEMYSSSALNGNKVLNRASLVNNNMQSPVLSEKRRKYSPRVTRSVAKSGKKNVQKGKTDDPQPKMEIKESDTVPKAKEGRLQTAIVEVTNERIGRKSRAQKRHSTNESPAERQLRNRAIKIVKNKK